MAYSGRFSPKNTNKYLGDPTNIWYRSLWERRVMVHLDENPSVIGWSNEEIVIPYRSPIDGRVHRYFPDFWVRMQASDGSINTVIIEIKPFRETKIPQRPEKLTRKFINEARTYSVNAAKWKAAQEYCLDRGWEFQIMTESDIFRKDV